LFFSEFKKKINKKVAGIKELAIEEYKLISSHFISITKKKEY
jgi:hypothetical protein